MTESEEQQDLRQLLRILETIDPWLEAVTTDRPAAVWEVEPRSPLSTDDARTHPYQVSHRAWMAITPAVDFLACLRESLLDAQGAQGAAWIRLCGHGAACR